MGTDRVWPILLFLLIGPGTPGCQPDPDPVDRGLNDLPLSTTRDSAGIEIVESVAAAWDGDGWRVAREPTVTIGHTSGDERYLFGEVVGAVVLRDGRIAVADRQAYLIRVYSPEGVHIEDWGGRGEGPGEFSGGIRKLLSYRGDSILVKQFASSGSNVYDDRGRFGRAVAPEMWLLFTYDRPSLGFDPTASSAGTCCTLWGPLPNGALLGSYSDMVSMAGSGTRWGSVMAAIVPAPGGAPEPVGLFKGGQYHVDGERQLWELQFQVRFSMTVGPDGYFATEGDAYSIEAYDADGSLRRIIRLAHGPSPLPDEVKADHEARLRAQFTSPEDEEWLRRKLAIPYPSQLPAFDWLHADPEGNVWARQQRFGVDDGIADAETHEYFVFGADGRHLGVIELPGSLEVYQIGADFLLGKVSDELGVDRVHLYRIEK